MKVEIPEGFLNGREIHNGWRFEYSDKVFASRFEVVEKLVNSDSRVIDLGPVDYLPNVEKKIKNNTWLHKILIDICYQVVGVDLNEEGVKLCNGLGYDDIIYADVVKDSSKIVKMFEMDKDIDYIMIGELLHEIDDPIIFLKKIKSVYQNKVRKIIVTVPNIYRTDNIVYGLNGVDVNHTDNRFWYSPYSICRMVSASGMIPDELFLAGRTNDEFTRLICKMHPHNICAENIVLTANI